MVTQMAEQLVTEGHLLNMNLHQARREVDLSLLSYTGSIFVTAYLYIKITQVYYFTHNLDVCGSTHYISLSYSLYIIYTYIMKLEAYTHYIYTACTKAIYKFKLTWVHIKCANENITDTAPYYCLECKASLMNLIS